MILPKGVVNAHDRANHPILFWSGPPYGPNTSGVVNGYERRHLPLTDLRPSGWKGETRDDI